MPFVGMDVEIVTRVSANLKAEADKLDGIVTTVDQLVSRAKATWHGRDAERLISLWQGSARGVLKNLSEDVKGLADKAKANADEQTKASENYGETSPSDGARETIWDDIEKLDKLNDLKEFTEGAISLSLGAKYFRQGVKIAGGILEDGGDWVFRPTFGTSIGMGFGTVEDLEKMIPGAGAALKIFPWLGIALDAGAGIHDFTRGDYVASGLDAAGVALGIAALATPVGWGVLAGGAAVAGASLLWSSLPAGFKASVNGAISTAVGDIGDAAVQGAKAVWNADVDEAKAVVHVAGDVVNAGAKAVDAGAKAVDAVADEGSKVLKTIFKKPSWATW